MGEPSEGNADRSAADRFRGTHGARAFASGGLLVSAAAFGGLLVLPTDFRYGLFAVLIFVAGAGMGLFSAPNAAAIMNSVPARQRGAASGMLATFQNSGFVLSIGVFFSLMIAGLANALPATLSHGLIAQGVPSGTAHQIAGLPPVGSLFAAFLGINPIRQLLAPTGALAHLPAASVARLTGKQFFPELISGPFHHGLVIVFSLAIVLLVIAAGISALRGGRYVHDEQSIAAIPAAAAAGAAGVNGAAGVSPADTSVAGASGTGTDVAGTDRADTDMAGANGADHGVTRSG